MSSRPARMLAAGGAAVLAAAVAAAPALAATTWTVQPGGAITAAAGKTRLTDTTTGTFLACGSSDMSGTLRSGGGLPGTGIGSITAAAYRCAAPTGRPTLAPLGLPWQLNLTSYDARTGVSRGTISHLKLALSVDGCDPVINGTSGGAADGVVAVSYSDQAGTLKILATGGNLHWHHVSRGCLGLVGNGDPAAFSASYAISPAQAITSP